MAHLNWTTKNYMNLLKAASSALVLTVSLWIALSQPNPVVFSMCTCLCAASLVGFASMKQTIFTLPLLTLAAVLAATTVTTPSKGLTLQITQTSQLLLLIYTIEIGSSTIHFNKTLQKTKKPKPTPATTKAIKHYITKLTTIITASLALSALLLFIGNSTPLKFEPIFLAATATAIMLITLAFLAANLRHPKPKTLFKA